MGTNIESKIKILGSINQAGEVKILEPAKLLTSSVYQISGDITHPQIGLRKILSSDRSIHGSKKDGTRDWRGAGGYWRSNQKFLMKVRGACPRNIHPDIEQCDCGRGHYEKSKNLISSKAD